MVNKSHWHHFIPRGYQKAWADAEKFVQIFDKEFPDKHMQRKSTRSLGAKENLNTARQGNTDVEDKYFKDIDDKASVILKKVQLSGISSLTPQQRKNFAIFLNTLYYRHPYHMDLIRQFNEEMRQYGAKSAQEKYDKTGEDRRHLYAKEQFDDSPKVVQFEHSKIDLDRIIDAEWMIFSSGTAEVITSDHPRIDFYLGGENSQTKLPEKFLITLPLNPSSVLFICNSREHISLFRKAIVENLIVQNNIDQIKHADKFIIAKTNTMEDLIRNYWKEFKASGKSVYINGIPK